MQWVIIIIITNIARLHPINSLLSSFSKHLYTKSSKSHKKSGNELHRQMNSTSIYMPMNPVTSPEPKHPHLNPWVITSVATICIIILLFTYLRILQRLCFYFSRNQDRRRLLNDTNPDDPSLQFHSHGLDFSLVHSLPITQFKKDHQGISEMAQSNTDCVVCLGQFEEGEWLRHLPNCKHVFHISCIDTWFLSHSNCPICRSEVYGLGLDHQYPASVYTLLETQRREEFFQERAEHYQFLRSTILQNSVSSTTDPRHAN